MSYIPQHNYRVKDGLDAGDAEKVIYGADLQDDFEAIARDLSTLDADNVADQADLDKEIQDRKNADNALQAQINNLSNGSDGNFVEAPEDGKLYGRQSSAWAEVVIPDAGEDYDDTGIKADLATETQARTDGDAALQSQIDGIQGYDDTALKADLATETQARTDGDAALQSSISSLTTIVDGKADPITVGGVPADPSEGDQWLNTADGYLYIYYGNGGSPTWMAVGGTA